MKKWLLFLLAVCLCCFFAGCGEKEGTQQSAGAGKLAGVSLAGSETDEFSQQIRQQLQLQGFQVEMKHACMDAAQQASQMEELIDAGADCLIVQAVDSVALLEVEAAAKEKEIPIIACDTLLMDTDWVWGCVSYDYEALGAEMAKQVVQAKKLEEIKGSATIEFFMGTPENNNALLLHKGAMSVFEEYLSSGKLVCASGRVSFEDTYVPGGSAQQAQEACYDRLSQHYGEKKLDICFAGSDEIAAGCRIALDEKGYTRDNWPALIGQGGENAQSVKDGYQLCTFQKDDFAMARQCATWALAAVNGENPPKGTTIFNHLKDVPVSYLPASLVES